VLSAVNELVVRQAALFEVRDDRDVAIGVI
jgi:hypothetical protein